MITPTAEPDTLHAGSRFKAIPFHDIVNDMPRRVLHLAVIRLAFAYHSSFPQRPPFRHDRLSPRQTHPNSLEHLLELLRPQRHSTHLHTPGGPRPPVQPGFILDLLIPINLLPPISPFFRATQPPPRLTLPQRLAKRTRLALQSLEDRGVEAVPARATGDVGASLYLGREQADGDGACAAGEGEEEDEGALEERVEFEEIEGELALRG